MGKIIVSLIFLLICILVTGCHNEPVECKIDCSESDVSCHCNENKTNENETNIFSNIFSNDSYCYVDNSLSGHYTCDVLVFPDGHNETKNCYGWNDLTMHYVCINLSEKNITLIKNVELNGDVWK